MKKYLIAIIAAFAVTAANATTKQLGTVRATETVVTSESDPSVHSWAKSATKPSYTPAEIGAQTQLVSGVNIKTINGEPVLGSGNIVITCDGIITNHVTSGYLATADSVSGIEGSVEALTSQVSSLASEKRDMTNMTVTVTKYSVEWMPDEEPEPENPTWGIMWFRGVVFDNMLEAWITFEYFFDGTEWMYSGYYAYMYGDSENPDATELTFPHGTVTHRVPYTSTTRLATTNDVATAIGGAGHMTQAQADAAYYPKAQGEAWSTYWDGDDVRVTVTNYDSVANLPSLYLEQRTNEVAQATNAFKVVWSEMAHWSRFLGTNWNWNATWGGFQTWHDSVNEEIANKADKAWGFYDSHTGAWAPEGFTSISSPNVMVCAGAAYQRSLVTSGEVWVLTANEPYMPTGISTNSTFQIIDHEGNVQVEIVKGDKVTAKAQANAVTVENGTTLVVTYNIIAGAHPTGEVCLDLANAQWKTEGAADCPATVAWSGSSGAYVARITPNQATGKCFFKATYQIGGETYVNNRCAVGMSKIVLGGVTYTLGTATISGHTVLTLTSEN